MPVAEPIAIQPLSNDRPPTPVILITGFLGSGKTTFILESLLPALHQRRPMLLVNDFGEIGFDARYLGGLGLEVREVQGGCLCCSAGGRLLEALAAIREGMDPGVLVIEGSGVADPYPILEALETGGYALEGVIGLVEPEHLAQHTREPVFHHQLQAAQILVISRADTAAPSVLAQARDRLRKLRGAETPIFLAREGAVEGPFLDLLSPLLPTPQPPSRPRLYHAHDRSQIGQRSLPLAGRIARADLVTFLQGLPSGVYRAKGICDLAEHPRPVAVNYAFGHWTLHATDYSDAPFLVAMGEPEALRALNAPPCLSEIHPGVPDRDMLPSGSADGRPGAAYVDGRLTDPLAAAETLLARLEACPDTQILLGRAELGTRVEVILTSLPFQCSRLDDYRYRHLLPRLRTLADVPTGTPLLTLGLPAAVVEELIAALPHRPVYALCDTWALAQAEIALNGMDEARLAGLLSCLHIRPAPRPEIRAPRQQVGT